MVVLEGCLAAVVEVAVGFDHDPPVSPKEVNEIRTDPDVDLRARQPMAATEAQEVPLQVAARATAALVPDWKTDDACLADRLP